jgi:UDP-N-acetylmuramoylalanine--D-glutamate ligase
MQGTNPIKAMACGFDRSWFDQPWPGKALTVLGLSKSGAAVARYAATRGATVFLSEYAPASPVNEALLLSLKAMGVKLETGGHGQDCFNHADMIVLSPGIPPSSAILAQLRLSGKTLVSEVEFAYQEAQLEKPVPFIGITGTNGKSTVSTLISHILCQSGLKAPVCGNIGIPVTEVIDATKNPDHLVVELSSYQLAFSPGLHANIAVLTNFKPDHLDWHGSLEHYRQSKLSLFTRSPYPAWSVLPADDPVSADILQQQQQSSAQQCWFSCDEAQVARFANKVYLDKNRQVIISMAGKASEPVFHVDQLQLIGRHNHGNVLASVAVACLSGVSIPHIREACLNFEGLEHRLKRVTGIAKKIEHPTTTERLTEQANIVFYNDSKATNTDAAIVAMQTFETQKIILIAGGYDKMTPLDEFVAVAKQHAEAVILIGKATQRFKTALAEAGYSAIHEASSLELAVEKAYDLSRGEPVLLSPACASFDMFENFEARGNAFVESVQKLSARLASLEKPVGSAG